MCSKTMRGPSSWPQISMLVVGLSTFMKHHLVRGASDARKVRVAYVRSEDQHADLLNEPLDMQKCYKHAKFNLRIYG